jgi:hypothetical protein
MAVMKAPPRRPHEIRIDRVDLPPGTVGTRRVRAAIERELARLLAETPASADTALPATQVAVEAGTDPDAIGVAVARQIHAGLKREGH